MFIVVKMQGDRDACSKYPQLVNLFKLKGNEKKCSALNDAHLSKSQNGRKETEENENNLCTIHKMSHIHSHKTFKAFNQIIIEKRIEQRQKKKQVTIEILENSSSLLR